MLKELKGKRELEGGRLQGKGGKDYKSKIKELLPPAPGMEPGAPSAAELVVDPALPPGR